MNTNGHDFNRNRKYVTVKLECSVPASAKIKIGGKAKSPNRENNVSAEISCSTVMTFQRSPKNCLKMMPSLEHSEWS